QSLRQRGKTSPETTDRGYELCSRGPVTRGFDALDNLVSASSRSSSYPSAPPQQSATSAPAPSAPNSPPSTAASATPTMADSSTADLAKMIENLATTVTSLQASVKDKSSSSSGDSRGHDGQHLQDRPSRFQKLDFPRYDGKSDPLVFINRYESYFHQQRIMEEEKVWMASYNLEEGA
ncbi:hypothetical protein U9M48_013475, partial [Paspalum notatum var. saurae]